MDFKNEPEDEESQMQAEVEDEPEINTVVLQNISLGNESEHIVFKEVTEQNSDGNLRIKSLEEDDTVVHTYIIDNNGDCEELHTEEVSNEEGSQMDEEEGGEHYILQDVDDMDQATNDSTIEYEYQEDPEDPNEYVDEPDMVEEQVEELDEDEAASSTGIKQEMLVCDLCDKAFKTTGGLKRHITVNHGDDDSQDDPLTFQLCPCCGEPSDSAHTLGDYKCDDCDKLFMQEAFLLRHRSIEHPDSNDSYPCVLCKEKFKKKHLLVEHMKIHPVKTFCKCEGCGREFSRKYHLDRHLNHTGCDGQEKKIFGCRVCDRLFTRKDNLAEHLRGHAGQAKKKRSLTCSYCKKEFMGLGLLNIHVRTHTGERPYACDFCEKRFSSCGAMTKHRRMHTGEKPYACGKCDKRFAAKETLNRHVRTHTGDRPHRCQFCGKSFIQAMQLRAHIFHHTGENAFQCPHCNRAFNRRVRLTTHIKFMHEGADPLPCEHCDKTFFRKEDVARHMLSHSGEKPYVCDVCDKCFTVKSSLKTHKLTHRKEPPCSCQTCGRAFIRQDCLMRHMRARHRDMLEDIMANAEKRKLQQQLLSAATDAVAKNGLTENIVWNELTLTESIKELLTLLVDDVCLEDFGYPEAPVDKVLDSVIKRCGYKPASKDDFDYIGRMRENAKLLFTVVIDDYAVKELLNNQTVDEVILHVLRLAKKQNASASSMSDSE